MTVVVTGMGSVVLGDGDDRADPTGYLRVRKNRKYMGLQDDLAVVAAGRALAQAGLTGTDLGGRAGLYLAVGYIPFRSEDIEPVLAASLADGEFSMERFADGGYQKAHPLLTFRCLPNMPAYHVSTNFDVQGPYMVSYPGAAQLYEVLAEACEALTRDGIDLALVGGVAHQRNFLVEHHFSRIDPPVPVSSLRDAGAFAVLEREERVRARGAAARGRLLSIERAYTPFDPLTGMPGRHEHVEVDGVRRELDAELGPGSLLIELARSFGMGGRAFSHGLTSRDGVRAWSRWEACP